MWFCNGLIPDNLALGDSDDITIQKSNLKIAYYFQEHNLHFPLIGLVTNLFVLFNISMIFTKSENKRYKFSVSRNSKVGIENELKIYETIVKLI